MAVIEGISTFRLIMGSALIAFGLVMCVLNILDYRRRNRR